MLRRTGCLLVPGEKLNRGPYIFFKLTKIRNEFYITILELNLIKGPDYKHEWKPRLQLIGYSTLCQTPVRPCKYNYKM